MGRPEWECWPEQAPPLPAGPPQEVAGLGLFAWMYWLDHQEDRRG